MNAKTEPGAARTKKVEITLGSRYCERLEDIAKLLNKTCEDAIIYILDVETGIREDELFGDSKAAEARS